MWARYIMHMVLYTHARGVFGHTRVKQLVWRGAMRNFAYKYTYMYVHNHWKTCVLYAFRVYTYISTICTKKMCIPHIRIQYIHVTYETAYNNVYIT